MIPKENFFDYIQINLASASTIQSWCERVLPNGQIIGEVTSDKTLNYRTLLPEPNGLFCQKIFGPIKDWECRCSKFKPMETDSVTCINCNVDIVESKVRRYRLGFVELSSFITHIWYLKARPCKIASVLEMKQKDVVKITYYDSLVILNIGKDPSIKYKYKQLVNEIDLMGNPLQMMKMTQKGVQFGVGAAAIEHLLDHLDVKKESIRLRAEISSIDCTENLLELEAAIKRLRLMEQFVSSETSPTSMILEIIPVLPPDLRPIIKMKTGGFMTTEINELYRRLIYRNNRLTEFLEKIAPELVVQAERIILQDTVDTLMDNGKRDRPELAKESSVKPKRALTSLSEIIKGKEGRFRQNLLGKRVDYSGRSVIISGPDLSLGTCGLPYEVAVELFKPFLVHRLTYEGEIQVFRQINSFIRNKKIFIANILTQIIRYHPVLLNRAPTLHRYGIQAFYPVIVYGQAIRLHPSVCVGFNADFDGDQMAVHIPLSIETQVEAGILLIPSANLFSPARDFDVIVTPTQDMIMGLDHLTVHNPPSQLLNEHYFSSFNDAITAYKHFAIGVQSFIWVRINEHEQNYFNFDKGLEFTEKKVNNQILYLNPEMQINKTRNGEIVSIYLKTTPGRILFNQAVANFNNEF